MKLERGDVGGNLQWRHLPDVESGNSVVATAGLAQSPQPEFFASLVGNHVACVGHEPWMSDALFLLTTGDPQGDWLRFKKGAVAWLRGPPSPASMQLRAFLPPRGQAPPT